MNKEEAIEQSINLINSSGIAFVGSIDDEGFPNIKAMIKMENEGLKRIYFSTNTSSKRVLQFQKNHKSCVYFVNSEQWKGLMLTGEIKVSDDKPLKQRLWRSGFEKYYKGGVEDPDYSVLTFTAFRASFYHNLNNVSFEIV